jgi:hypothetical protein
VSTVRPNPPRLDRVPPGTETCDCCAGVERETPRMIENRTGLSAVAYRIGTYSEFRASLHGGLSSKEFEPLLRLQTRDDDDFTIGLLDAVACAADVLTFYQERIANESYLRTARERLSLQEMGRLIGYRLRPGVAAETWLAFTLETPPDPPANVKPDPGMFVTGVPAEVTIDAGLAVRSVPAPGQLPQVFETTAAVTARPVWNAIQPWMSHAARPGSGSTFTFLSGVNTNLRRGDALLFVGAEFLNNRSANEWDFRILDRVEADAANNRTRVSWSRPLGSLSPPKGAAAMPRIFALRQRASVYGHHAPAWGSMPLQFRIDYEAAFPRADKGVILAAFVEGADWPHFAVSREADAVDLDTVYSAITAGSFVVLAKGAFNYPSEPAPKDTYVELYLVTTVAEVSRQEFGLSAKVSRLGLDGANYSTFKDDPRGTSVFAHSEELALAEYPVDDPAAGAIVPVTVSADGLQPGRRLLIRGRQSRGRGEILHSAALVAAHPIDGRRCVLEIDPPLPEPLDRASVVVYANVAPASHGESVTQILGAGDAATPFQRFELKQVPLTFRAAATEAGAASELTVRVDDIAWKTSDTLFGAGPRDRVNTLISDEQDRTFVQFGDGLRGARLPTGVNNVRARYRKGLGKAGNVAAESLTQLTTRPLGVKGVSNPGPAEGGTDPEQADQARQTMPLMTRTLGRAVSVLDYEDFARAFSGVAKARAQVLQLPSGPTVVITIAGQDGAPISASNPIGVNLRAALAASGDPHVAVRLLSYRASTFRLGLTVKRDPDESRQVLAAVESALRAHFGFSARELGQPVQQSDVIGVAQGVPGVIAVDLDMLYGGTQPGSQTTSSLQTRLLASRMTVSAGEPQPDELLTLDPAPLDRLEEMR